jgi:hypothetical protein
LVKVLNIISDKNVGGAGRVLLNYLKYCDRANFRVSVALPTGSLLIKPLRELSVDVHAIDITPDRSFCLSDVKKLRRLIKKTNPDIVHTTARFPDGLPVGCAEKRWYLRAIASFP